MSNEVRMLLERVDRGGKFVFVVFVLIGNFCLFFEIFRYFVIFFVLSFIETPSD